VTSFERESDRLVGEIEDVVDAIVKELYLFFRFKKNLLEHLECFVDHRLN